MSQKMDFASKVRTCLWFDGNGEEAVNYYVSLLPDNSKIENVVKKPDGSVLVMEFTLSNVPYMILNGGPYYTLSPCVSISVLTEDQEETDRLWEALTSNGGHGSNCGWLVDRFGLSWQIIPKAMPRMLSSPDREAAGRAHAAMGEMKKIDIAKMEAAFSGSE